MKANKDFKAQFAQLLANTQLSSNAPQEEAQRIWNEINNLIWANIPQKLFRFRTCNTDNIISFQSGTIHVCVANAFKDKYDSLAYINRVRIDKEINGVLTSDDIEIACSSGELKHLSPIIESFFGKEIAEQLELTFAESSKAERADLFHQSLQLVQNFTSTRIQIYRELMRKDGFTKLACFTEDITSLYMWDQYADGYRGFALEYDFRLFHTLGCSTCPQNRDCKQTQKVFPDVYPVIYSDERYDATYNIVNIILREALTRLGLKNMLPPIDQLFWFKSYLYKDAKAYSHEKEWRLITHCPYQLDNDYATIPDHNCLKAIYYGPHMEKRHKDFLKSIATQKAHAI